MYFVHVSYLPLFRDSSWRVSCTITENLHAAWFLFWNSTPITLRNKFLPSTLALSVANHTACRNRKNQLTVMGSIAAAVQRAPPKSLTNDHESTTTAAGAIFEP